MMVYIPSNLGYGPRGAGDVIPPDSNLIFVIEMLDKK
jgi:FKBP-type peptidyl-prolyl cis-trans isomerase